MKKKVSIIVPVYNVEEYIEKCLYKLVNQTIDDFEIIIIIDGSTDKSIDIVKKYKNKYPNLINVFETENRGLSAARNFGLEKAKGDYIGFVDSDDWVKITMFEKMYNYAIANECDIVVCDYYKVIGKIQNEMILNINQDENFKSKIINSRPYAWNKLYKKTIFEQYKLKFPEGMIFEDICTIYPLLMQCKKIGYVNERLYYYNIRMNSIMTSKNREDLEILSILRIFNDYCKNNDLFKDFEDTIYEINVRHIYYRMREIKQFNNTKRYNTKFINESFSFLNKEFPGWRKKCNYARNMKFISKSMIFWQIRNLIAG